MAYFQPELVKLSIEERRSQLMAEAAQWRMLKESRADWSGPTCKDQSARHRRWAALWCWLVQR